MHLLPKKFNLSKLLFLISLIVVFNFLFGLPCLARTNVNDLVGMKPVAENIALGTQDLRVTIARIIQISLGLLGAVAVVLVLYGGFLWMTAQGVAEKVDKAKKLLVSATIGLVIVLTSFAIASFIIIKLLEATGGGGGGDDDIGPGDDDDDTWGENCPNPSTTGNEDPWLCIKEGDTSGGSSKIITLYGGNVGTDPGTIYFTDKDKVKTYPAEIIKCKDTDVAWFTPMSGSTFLSKVRVRVPEGLILAENNYFVVADPAGSSSPATVSKDWGMKEREDRFEFDGTAYTGPNLICFLDDTGGVEGDQLTAAHKDQPIRIKGERFEAAQGTVTFNFQDTKDNGLVSSWTDSLIFVTVPETASGNVRVIRPSDNQFAEDWLNILCTTATAVNDCGTNCCKRKKGQFVCVAHNDCLGNEGDACNDGADCAATEFGCKPGLYCESTSCECREIGRGAPCSSDLLACVPDDTKCGGGFYCSNTASCTCRDLPLITDIDPTTAGTGNFVTISGRGFGSVITPGVSKVILLGGDADAPPDGSVEGDGDDREAILPSSCGENAIWQDDQVIIEIPLDAVTGPIKLINSDGLTEYTDDADGGYTGDLTIAAVNYPSLCAAIPNDGEFQTSVELRGKNFGPETQGKAFIGNEASEFTHGPDWTWGPVGSLDVITDALVPNLAPARLTAQIKSGEIFSNKIKFTVLDQEESPQIDYIDPVQGTQGQYITIFGSNFGKAVGLVYFRDSEGGYVVADTSFPAACANNYWHDTFIVVKVPNLGPSSFANSDVYVLTADEIASEPEGERVAFNYCLSCVRTPGLCLVDPNQGPVATAVDFHGDNFGAFTEFASKVVFYDGQSVFPGAANWDNQLIENVLVPAGAQEMTAPVYVADADGNVSNKMLFTVADCTKPGNENLCDTVNTGNICCERDGVCKTETACFGAGAQMCHYQWSFSTGQLSNVFEPPQVLEDIECEEDTQSPSPWLNSETNCRNSQISARFNMPISVATLTPQNIVVKECSGGKPGDASFVCNNDAWNLADATVFPMGNIGFIYEPPTGEDLTPGTWYQVLLLSGSAGIRSEYGIWLDGDEDGQPGGNYDWVFRSRDDVAECTIEENDKVIVRPPEALIENLGTTIDYTALAMKANCNILNGNEFDWDWYKVYQDTNNTVEDAEIPDPYAAGCTKHTCIADISEVDDNPKDGRRDWRQVGTPLKQGKTYVSVKVGDKADENNELVIDLNIPEIYRIYPDNGLLHPDVNAYVDIYGTNFGAIQGNSQVLFDDLAVSLAPNCDKVWADDHIKVLVPKSIPVPADNKKTYTGINIKSGTSVNIFYDFEDSSGVELEDKAGNNDGQIFDATRMGSDFGQAMAFNGTSAYVRMSDNYKLQTGSVELAFKPTNLVLGQKQTLFSVSDGTATNVLALNIVPVDSDNAQFEVSLKAGGSDDSSATTVNVIKKNVWHYLAFTYDGSKYYFYLNGRKFYYFFGSNLTGSTVTASWKNTDIADPDVLLGAQNNGSITGFYNGLIDNFALYQRVLDEEEIRSRYGLATGQILLLNFDELGPQVVDYSANAFGNITTDYPDFRIEEGKYGRGFGNASMIVTNNPSLNFKDKFSIEGWFKVNTRATRFHIYRASAIEGTNTRISLGSRSGAECGTAGLCFKLFLVNKNDADSNGYRYAVVPESNIVENKWNYFAATFDGDKVRVYLNSAKVEYTDSLVSSSRIYEHNFFDQALIGDSVVQLDNLAVYNRVLSDGEIGSRLGANNGANVIVRTSFGEDDSWSDTNQLFYHSDLVHPFICKLQPNAGPYKTQIKISGDNFGDDNTTLYLNKTYDIGSLVSWNGSLPLFRDNAKPWTNTMIRISNPFDQSDTPEIPVLISIDPAAEPFIDEDGLGVRNAPELYADILLPSGVYNPGNYEVEVFDPANPTVISAKVQYPNILSNTEYYYMPPVITSITPDNGPVKQWVTIKGYNFGNTAGSVYFFNNQLAAFPPAPCQGVWTNTQIVVEVPAGAKPGDVYLVNSYGLSSNRVKYAVNNKPLGPGLCQIAPNYSWPRKPVLLKGVRFDPEGNGRDAADNAIFYNNKLSPWFWSWDDKVLNAYVPDYVEEGDVVVSRRYVTGQRCVGFKIGSWCPSNKYETLYENIPSNPLFLNLIPPCGEKNGTVVIRNYENIASGFPISPGPTVDTGILATDGYYLYTKAAQIDPPYTSGSYGNYQNIYKIGTGEHETVKNQIYKIYTPATPADGDLANRHTMAFHQIGDTMRLYLGLYKRQNKVNHFIYYLEFSDGPGTTGTYSVLTEQISETLLAWHNPNVPDIEYPADTYPDFLSAINITSNGKYLFNIASIPMGRDKYAWWKPMGYRVKVFYVSPSHQWKKIKEFELLGTGNLNPYMTGAASNSIVVGDLVYLTGPNNRVTRVFNWQDEQWVAWWSGVSPMEKAGQYDWVNNLIWTAERYSHGDPNSNRIYKYDACPLGGCVSDADCLRCGEGTSRCENGACTPYISQITPQQGPIGEWVDIYGCYFCTNPAMSVPGQVFFTDEKEGFFLEDIDPECGSSWKCSGTPCDVDDVSGSGCDAIEVEVPNDQTPADTTDDAITGPVTVTTGSYPYFTATSADSATADDFVVTAGVPLSHTICELIPYYSNRGIDFRIHGRLFGETAGFGTNDHVYFGLGDGLNAREPWQDEDGNGVYTSGEPFIDFNNNESYNESLPNQLYSFNITDYVPNEIISYPGKPQTPCPADGWGDKDICVSVPQNKPNLAGGTANAGGQGNAENQADNHVKVVKETIASNAETFKVTFGLCGNAVIDPGELCDGTNIPTISCCQLGWPGADDCTITCNNSCGLLACDVVTGVCHTIDPECGNGTEENYCEEDPAALCQDPIVCKPGGMSYVEDCDDGNIIAGDGCSPTCQIEDGGGLCGNGVLDDDTPTDLHFEASVSTGLGAQSANVRIKGNYAYVANYFTGPGGSLPGGLAVVDISNPNAPRLVTNLTTGSQNYDIDVQGNYAYAGSTGSGLQVIDITNPENPQLKGSFKNADLTSPVIVSVQGDYAYVAEGSVGGTTGKLGIFNVSNPAAPTEVKQLVSGTLVMWVDVKDNYSYMTVDQGGQYYLRIVDVSDPATASVVASVKTMDFPRGVYVKDNYAYVAIVGGAGGLEIFDVSNPSLPTSIGSVTGGGANWSVFVQGNYAYMGGTANGLRIFDVSDPAAPELTFSATEVGDSRGVVVQGNYIYITNRGSGLLQVYSSVGEECDDGCESPGNPANCDDFPLNDGDGCSSKCKIEAPGEARPYVESTSPIHNSQDMCRNAIIQVTFNQTTEPAQYIKTASVTKDNFKLQVCVGGDSITQERKGLWQRVVSYFKNIINKLLGRQRQAVAAIACTSFDNVPPENYELDYEYVNKRTRVSIVPAGLLDPHEIYRVRLSHEIQNGLGNYLDVYKTGFATPIANPENDYVFEFATLGEAGMGSEQTGICTVDDIKVQVYSTRYASDWEDASNIDKVQGRESDIKEADLFMCAGKNDCRLVHDYDQDFGTNGNQHIYRAIGQHSGGLTLKANFTWERQAAFDPKKIISIYAPNALPELDTNPNGDIVANNQGWVYTTAAGVKEGWAQLVISAQAEGDTSDPRIENFPIYILLCENPWPSLSEKFPIASIINAYNYQLYYCRDAGKSGDTSDDLPAARWLFPDISKLEVITNTDFEAGTLANWIPLSDFTEQPLYSTSPINNRQGVWWIDNSKGYEGGEILDKGNVDLGVLQSSVFVIEGDELRFLIGGQAGNPGAINNPSFTDIDDPEGGEVGVVLAILEDPSSPAMEIVRRQAVPNSPQMAEQTFNISDFKTGRPCTSNANCGSYGTCECEGTCSVNNSGQCSTIAGIIYIYDNDTSGYVSFDNLRQYKAGVRIPLR